MDSLFGYIDMFWPFLVLIVVFYFFMYRPQKKQQQERGRFLLSLKKGDHVVTAGGIHGVIRLLRDKYVQLEIAPKVVIKVDKSAIQSGDVNLISEEEAKKGKDDDEDVEVVEEVHYVEVDPDQPDEKPVEKKAEDKKPEPKKEEKA